MHPDPLHLRPFDTFVSANEQRVPRDIAPVEECDHLERATTQSEIPIQREASGRLASVRAVQHSKQSSLIVTQPAEATTLTSDVH
jgi:hypothetical protein